MNRLRLITVLVCLTVAFNIWASGLNTNGSTGSNLQVGDTINKDDVKTDKPEQTEVKVDEPIVLDEDNPIRELDFELDAMVEEPKNETKVETPKVEPPVVEVPKEEVKEVKKPTINKTQESGRTTESGHTEKIIAQDVKHVDPIRVEETAVEKKEEPKKVEIPKIIEQPKVDEKIEVKTPVIIRGSITVKLMNGTSILKVNKISNLSLGEYPIKADKLKGYILNDKGLKVVNITENNSDVEVIFDYKKDCRWQLLILAIIALLIGLALILDRRKHVEIYDVYTNEKGETQTRLITKRYLRFKGKQIVTLDITDEKRDVENDLLKIVFKKHTNKRITNKQIEIIQDKNIIYSEKITQDKIKDCNNKELELFI